MGAMKMIKLQRPSEPQKLIDNKAVWQQNLNTAIAKYGSYKEIPEDEREKLIRYYKDETVKTPLFESSHQKCAYCECNATEGGYMEVDHFRPNHYTRNLYLNGTIYCLRAGNATV
jgi:hypothetical protein